MPMQRRLHTLARLVEPFGNGRVDVFQKIEKLGGAMTLVTFADHKPRRDIERGKKRGGSVTDVIMNATLRNARRHRQDRLLQIQRVDLTFLVDAEDKRPCRRDR